MMTSYVVAGSPRAVSNGREAGEECAGEKGAMYSNCNDNERVMRGNFLSLSTLENKQTEKKNYIQLNAN